MSEKSMSRKLIIDYMKSHNLLLQSFGSPSQRVFYSLFNIPDNIMNSTFEKEKNPNTKMRKLSS